MKRLSSLVLLCALALPLVFATGVQAVVLEGVGHASIYNGDLETAPRPERLPSGISLCSMKLG